jgi:hypothetical protein
MKILWRFAPWLSRSLLIPPALIFTLIAVRYLTQPAQAAAEVGIAVTSPLGMTILRVGFGAFPLGCSIFVLACLVSERRISTGLGFVATIIAVLMIVRSYSMVVDRTVKESMALIYPEALLMVLCFIGLFIEFRRPRRRIEDSPRTNMIE